jgi:hypothetical protein
MEDAFREFYGDQVWLNGGDESLPWFDAVFRYYLTIGDLADTKFAIIEMGATDGRHLPLRFYEGREIIVISEHVSVHLKRFQGRNGYEPTETHPDVQHLIFVILHEIAHAVKHHLSPGLDRLDEKQADEQEHEAKDLALHWFNRSSRQPNKWTLADVRAWPPAFASISAVAPFLSLALTSAPLASSACTTARWPPSAALISASA